MRSNARYQQQHESATVCTAKPTASLIHPSIGIPATRLDTPATRASVAVECSASRSTPMARQSDRQSPRCTDSRMPDRHGSIPPESMARPRRWPLTQHNSSRSSDGVRIARVKVSGLWPYSCRFQRGSRHREPQHVGRYPAASWQPQQPHSTVLYMTATTTNNDDQ
jgi:hypothetical protein